MAEGGQWERRWCEQCGRRLFGEFRCQWRFCPSRIKLYYGDQSRILKVNLAAWGDRPITMLSLTAGGTKTAHGRWDEQRCAHRGPHDHSGPAGCRVVRFEAAVWNATAPSVGKAPGCGLFADAAALRQGAGRGARGGLATPGARTVHVHVVVGFEVSGLGMDVVRSTGRRCGSRCPGMGSQAVATDSTAAARTVSVLVTPPDIWRHLSPDDGSLAEAVRRHADLRR